MSSQINTPCCPVGGFLRTSDTDPNAPYECGKCGRAYTTAEVLGMIGAPVRRTSAAATPNSRNINTTYDPWAGMLPLPGKTYDVKEELKLLGAKWNPKDRVWMVPQARYDEAKQIVARGPTTQFPPPGQATHYTTAFASNWPFSGATVTGAPGSSFGRRTPTPVPIFYGDVGDEDSIAAAEEKAKQAVKAARDELRKKGKLRACWECGGDFAEATTDGNWDECWCGCSDDPKKLEPAVAVDDISWDPWVVPVGRR